METDSDWDDLYVGQSSPGGESEDADAWQQRHANPDTLISHMEWQLNLTPMSDRDRVIAQIIIEALDERGFVTVPLEDLVTTANNEIADPDDPVEDDEVVAVLHRLQQFDPVGVASRDLAECLGVQLGQLPEDTPIWPRPARCWRTRRCWKNTITPACGGRWAPPRRRCWRPWHCCAA